MRSFAKAKKFSFTRHLTCFLGFGPISGTVLLSSFSKKGSSVFIFMTMNEDCRTAILTVYSYL
jgi:hypothetical protein